MFFGAVKSKARRICNACDVGREQTKWTQDWFFGWNIKKIKMLTILKYLDHTNWTNGLEKKTWICQFLKAHYILEERPKNERNFVSCKIALISNKKARIKKKYIFNQL